MPRLGDRHPYDGPDTPLLLLGREPGPDGTYGRPTPDSRLPRDPSDPSIWLPGQGRANACGTTTLAYVLRYLLGPAAPERTRIDASVRRADIFTAPSLMVGYARKLGLAAESYNGATIDLILDLVDRDVPVMVLTDTTPLDLTDTANLHWVAVVGHDDDMLAIYNPHGFQEAIDRASFESHWQEARLFGLPAWRRYAIGIARSPAQLPAPPASGASALGATWAASGVAGLVNGATSLRRQFETQSAVRAALTTVPGSLGLVAPALQTAAGVAVLVAGAWRARRSPDRAEAATDTA